MLTPFSHNPPGSRIVAPSKYFDSSGFFWILKFSCLKFRSKKNQDQRRVLLKASQNTFAGGEARQLRVFINGVKMVPLCISAFFSEQPNLIFCLPAPCPDLLPEKRIIDADKRTIYTFFWAEHIFRQRASKSRRCWAAANVALHASKISGLIYYPKWEKEILLCKALNSKPWLGYGENVSFCLLEAARFCFWKRRPLTE